MNPAEIAIIKIASSSSVHDGGSRRRSWSAHQVSTCRAEQTLLCSLTVGSLL